MSESIFVSAENLTKVENFLPIRGSIEDLLLKESSFHIVYSHGVVRHTQDPEKPMFELWRVLRPGGNLVVWVDPEYDFMYDGSIIACFMVQADPMEKMQFAELIAKFGHFVKNNWKPGSKLPRKNLLFALKS